MKQMLVAVILFSGAAAMAQTSFDEYFASSKQHRSGRREIEFQRACGISRSDAQVSYGLSTELEGFKFHRTKSLMRGRDEALTDFFGSAELWKIDGRPRFIHAWMLVMDVGQTREEMFCLNDRGRITMQESLNAVDGETSGTAGWIHIQRRAIDASGRMKVLRSGYVRRDGSAVHVPRKRHEESANSRVAADEGLADDVIAALSK